MHKRFLLLLIVFMIIVPALAFAAGQQEAKEVTTLKLWTQPNVNSERYCLKSQTFYSQARIISDRRS